VRSSISDGAGSLLVWGSQHREDSVNKAELIEALAQHYEGSKADATKALNAVVQTITYTAAAGEKVAITGFGVFEKIDRPARMVRNPRTGERKEAAATSVPRFRPGTELKAYVAGERALPDGVTPVSTPVRRTPARTSTTTTTVAPVEPAPATAAPVEVAAEPEAKAPKKPAAGKKASSSKAAPAKAASSKAASSKAASSKTASSKVAAKAPSKKDSKAAADKKDSKTKKKDGKKSKSGK
jgi:DNA-binding protein HU-beta